MLRLAPPSGRVLVRRAVAVPHWPGVAGSASAALATTADASSEFTPAAASAAPRLRYDEGWGRGRYYTKTHEWFEVIDEGVGIVGITRPAQRALGEIVFCRLPRPGDRFRVMDTLATLEAVKTVGEVRSPIYGEVLEVNPRLEREPALVTVAPLTEGWLVRLAFNGAIPRYLRRSRAVPREDIDELLAEPPALRAWLQERLLPVAGDELDSALRELTFDGLSPPERYFVHVASQQLGLVSASRGVGPSRQLVVRIAENKEEDSEDEDDGVYGGDGGLEEAGGQVKDPRHHPLSGQR